MAIGPCGLVCAICRYYLECTCDGGRPAGWHPPRNDAASVCPIIGCTARRGVDYCPRDCAAFPCDAYDARFPYRARSFGSYGQGRGDWLEDSRRILGVPQPGEDVAGDSLRVFCLGKFRVLRGPAEIGDSEWGQARGPTRKIKALFAFLVHCGEFGVHKDTLLELLWPEQEDLERANANLYLAVYYLRRALEPDLEPYASSRYIHLENERYRFEPPGSYWSDADSFERFCLRARMLTKMQRTRQAAIYWTLAVNAYSGPYMAGISAAVDSGEGEAWYQSRRVHFQTLFLEALLAMGRTYYHLGAWERAMDCALQVLEVDGTDEVAHRLVMRCFLAQREPDLAIRHYRLCAAVLDQNLGCPPSPETDTLYQFARSRVGA